MAAKELTPEQIELREKRREEIALKKAQDIANAERDAPIRARFHAWLEGAGFRKFETPPLGSVYPGAHIETLWEAYLDATLSERTGK